MNDPAMSHALGAAANWLGMGGVVVSNAAAWAAGFDPGATVTTLTIVGIGLVGLGLTAYKQIDQARLDRRKVWDETMKGSLSEQVAALLVQGKEAAKRVEDANKHLHEIKDDAQTAMRQHELEVLRLIKQLELAQEQLDRMAKELRMAREERDSLRDLVKGVGSIALNTREAVKDVKATVDAVAASNSDPAMPAHRPEVNPGASP